MKLKRARGYRRGRIEIIPMIDVMFFLLVTFMLASLAMQSLNSIAVNLPKGEAESIKHKEPVTLTVMQDKKLFLDKTPVTLDTLAFTLKRMLTRSGPGASGERRYRRAGGSCGPGDAGGAPRRSRAFPDRGQARMNADAQLHWRENFDEPWRRLPWVILAALIAWIVLLGGFARMLEQQARAATAANDDRSPDHRVAAAGCGFAGRWRAGRRCGSAASGTGRRSPSRSLWLKPKPVVHHVRKARVKPPPAYCRTALAFRYRKARRAARAGRSAGCVQRADRRRDRTPRRCVRKEQAVSAAAPIQAAVRASAATIPAPGRCTRRRRLFPMICARATFSTVAVARFKVSPEGAVDVALVKPTPNPRLNQILLDTLKQWKFFPAMKDGVAINSEFEVRIPIAVQ